MRIPTARTSGLKRIAAAFADSGKRAAFMPYLMGGFPDLATSRGIGEAYAAAGADLVELGVPFSDPLADGPVIQAAGTAALAAGATVEDVVRVGGALSASVPVVHERREVRELVSFRCEPRQLRTAQNRVQEHQPLDRARDWRRFAKPIVRFANSCV